MYRVEQIGRIGRVERIPRIEAPTKAEWEKLRKLLDTSSKKELKPRKSFADYLEEALEEQRRPSPQNLERNVNFEV